MANRELKKLGRAELLELLLEESKENERLRTKLRKAKQLLEEKQDQIENAQSIAEAALQLNGAVEAAEAAAEQYLENVRRMAEASVDEQD